jgi:hypothetical protein
MRPVIHGPDSPPSKRWGKVPAAEPKEARKYSGFRGLAANG